MSSSLSSSHHRPPPLGLEETTQQDLLSELRNQRENLLNREKALKELTDDAYKTIEQYIASTKQIEDMEYEMMELINENEHLREELARKEAENHLITDEYKKSISYIEELHFQLTERIEEIANLEMDIEKLKVEILASSSSHGGPSPVPKLRSDKDKSPTLRRVSEKEPKFQRLEKNQSSIRKIHGFRERASLILNGMTEETMKHSSNSPHDINKRPITSNKSRKVDGTTTTTTTITPQIPSSATESYRDAHETTATTTTAVPLSVEDKKFYTQQLIVLRRTIAEKESHIHLLQARLTKNELDKEKGKGNGRGLNKHSEDPDERTRGDLLHLIRKNMEEKIHWQTYAEHLLKRIISGCPSLIDVNDHPVAYSSGLNDDPDSAVNVWQEYALTLIQKVVTHAPKILNEADLTMAERVVQNQIERSALASNQQPATLLTRGMQQQQQVQK